MIRKPVIQRQKPMNQKTNDSDKSETKACLRSWDNKSFWKFITGPNLSFSSRTQFWWKVWLYLRLCCKKGQPFSVLKQILKSEYFLWRTASWNLNYRWNYFGFISVKYSLTNDLLKYIFLGAYHVMTGKQQQA